MRAYAYLYFAGISALLTGIALVAYLSGVHNLNTGGMMTQKGEDLTRFLLAIGIVGLVTIVLALLGKLRWLFPIYALVLTIMMFRWLFMSGYAFDDAEAFRHGILFIAGALLATVFSIYTFKGRKNRRR